MIPFHPITAPSVPMKAARAACVAKISLFNFPRLQCRRSGSTLSQHAAHRRAVKKLLLQVSHYILCYLHPLGMSA